MKFVDPKVDIAFKKIFGDETRKHVLISFLNAVMDKDIVDVQIMNPYQVPKIPELKFTNLDVKARDKRGREFIVEMQANPYKYFDKRALDYVSRAYANQLNGGQDYDAHQPVYFIGVLNFNFFKSCDYLCRHLILNVETQEHEIQAFEFFFIELPKFSKGAHELVTILDKWTYFLKEIDQLNELPEELAKEPAIKDAASTANRATWTKEEIEAYEYGHREEARELKMIRQLEENATALEQKDKALEQKEKALEQKDKVLEQKDKVLEQKEKELERKDRTLEEREKLLRQSIHMLLKLKQTIPEIADSLALPEAEVKRLMETR